MKGRSKFFIILLYILPILFFLIGYFLLTTSGEDIFQGANTFRTSAPSISSDLAAAFEHSGRITDMYAWTVIDFFDYQFRFGPDLIFRLLDVAMISASLYLATYLTLERRPSLHFKDALIFDAIFTALVFSPFGRRLYSEFSMIHNYVPLVLLTLLFVIPYLKLMLQSPFPRPRLLAVILPPLGFIFGMSTTITPLAVFAVIVLYCLFYRKHLARLPVWFFMGLITLLVGWSISFFLSPGMNSYATNPTSAATFDYVGLSSVFTDFSTAVPRLLFHLAYNFALILTPLIIVLLICIIFSSRPLTLKNLKTPTSRKYLFVFLSFILIHVLATIQIKSPPRILIPAYLAGIILLFKLFVPFIKSKLLATTVVIFTTIAIGLHTVFLAIYHINSAAVLAEIKSSEAPALCIEHSRIVAPHLPIINLGQEYILVDWGTPEIIYDKAVTFCE